MDLSVVIPAYNEEKVIADTIAEIKSYLKNNFASFEIIVVDDKSKDKTLAILKNIDDIIVLKNLKNHGKGYTVKKGVARAKGELILFMDADNSTKIKELDDFILYTKDYSLLIASRGLKESNITLSQNNFKKFLGHAGNLFSRLIIDPSIKDTQCGFKLFKKELKDIFARLTIEDFAFDFELIFLARKYNFRIKELPVTWTNNFESTVRWHSYPKSLWHLALIRINNLLGKYN